MSPDGMDADQRCAAQRGLRAPCSSAELECTAFLATRAGWAARNEGCFLRRRRRAYCSADAEKETGGGPPGSTKDQLCRARRQPVSMSKELARLQAIQQCYTVL